MLDLDQLHCGSTAVKHICNPLLRSSVLTSPECTCASDTHQLPDCVTCAAVLTDAPCRVACVAPSHRV